MAPRTQGLRTDALIAGSVACAACLTGCVERRLIITSDPSGAGVELNGVDVGITPLEVDFTYYGVYDVYLTKPGHASLRTSADADAPWYEWPGIDIISQAVPPTDRTEIRWHFTLEELVQDNAGLLERARSAKSAFESVEPEGSPNDARQDGAGTSDPGR